MLETNWEIPLNLPFSGQGEVMTSRIPSIVFVISVCFVIPAHAGIFVVATFSYFFIGIYFEFRSHAKEGSWDKHSNFVFKFKAGSSQLFTFIFAF